MRTLSKLLLVGGALAVMANRSKRRRPRRRVVSAPARRAKQSAPARVPDAEPYLELDIEDALIEGIDEVTVFHVERLEDTGLVDPPNEADVPPRSELDEIEALVHGTGELYGMHTPPAVDREPPEDRVAAERGESWIEALEELSVENGPEPEHELNVIDDEDVDRPPHASDARDTPVADRGSGGPGGV